MKHNYEKCSNECSYCKDRINDLENGLSSSDYSALKEMGFPSDVVKMFYGEKSYSGQIAYHTNSKTHYAIKKEAQRRGLSLSKTIDALILEGIEIEKKEKYDHSETSV